MEIGKYLAKVREANGYKTKSQLATKSGLSLPTISRIESGVHLPSPETLRAIAECYHTVTYEELLQKVGYLEEDNDEELKKHSPQIELLISKAKKLNQYQIKLILSLMDEMIK